MKFAGRFAGSALLHVLFKGFHNFENSDFVADQKLLYVGGGGLPVLLRETEILFMVDSTFEALCRIAGEYPAQRLDFCDRERWATDFQEQLLPFFRFIERFRCV